MRTSIVVRISLPRRQPIDLELNAITGKTTLSQVREKLLELATSHSDPEVCTFLTTWAWRGRLSSNPGFEDDRKTLSECFGNVWKAKYGNTMLELLDCDRPDLAASSLTAEDDAEHLPMRRRRLVKGPGLSLIHI